MVRCIIDLRSQSHFHLGWFWKGRSIRYGFDGIERYRQHCAYDLLMWIERDGCIAVLG